MSTQESWRIDADRAWRLYSGALMGVAELACEMRRLGMGDGGDLAEDAENLRPVLLAGVVAALAEKGGGRA